MAIKISLSGLDIVNNAELMNHATIKGSDVDIELKDTMLSGVSVMDSIQIDQTPKAEEQHTAAKTSEDPASGKKSFRESLKRGVSSLGKDLLVNLAADKISEKF